MRQWRRPLQPTFHTVLHVGTRHKAERGKMTRHRVVSCHSVLSPTPALMCCSAIELMPHESCHGARARAIAVNTGITYLHGSKDIEG